MLCCTSQDWQFLQYLEEPVQDVRDLPSYFSQTGIPIGLDETLDEAFAAQHHDLGLNPEERLAKLVCELGEGAVAGLVVKPGAVGGFERALDLQRWAGKRGIHVSGVVLSQAAVPGNLTPPFLL